MVLLFQDTCTMHENAVSTIYEFKGVLYLKKQGLGANLIEATSCAKVMLTYGPSYVHVVRDDFGR